MLHPASFSLRRMVDLPLQTGAASMNRAPEFFAPLPLLSVAVLALNDHWLKARFHNTFTGKLSDFAGCFLLPLFVSAVLALLTTWSLQRRVMLGLISTALLFIPIKVSTVAADQVERMLELSQLGRMQIIADPTDLLAVPMLFLAAFFALRKVPHASMA